MDEAISDASTGDRPREPSNARPKRTRQQPIRLEDEMAGGKKPNRDGKSLKDELGGTRKDQWLEAIRELTNVINGQNKMIKEQSVKLQELEAKLSDQGRFEQEKADKVETKLDEMKALIISVQDKLSTFSQNARIDPEVDGNTEIWPQLPAPQTQYPLMQLAMSLNAATANHRLLRNSPETNDRTITLDTSRSRSEKSNAAKIKEEVTSIMQAQLETKDCKIQHVRILPGEKIEICMETDSQCENARHYPRWLELAMPGARMKGETWFPIKCDNVPKSQVMKEGSLGTALKDDLLPAFKEDNDREGSPDMTAKKVVWLSKVSDRPMGSLVIWLKKEAARDFLLREQVAMFGAGAAWTSIYVKRETPERCFNCNTYGHMQARCTKPTACGVCSGKHHTRECQCLDQPRCTACQGPHRVTDPGCQEYLKRKAIIQQKAPANKDNAIPLTRHEQ